jgi:hypothetical protein
MTIRHSPPRQDRRGIGRAPVRKHDKESVGTVKHDPSKPVKPNGSYIPGSSAPGAVGPSSC